MSDRALVARCLDKAPGAWEEFLAIHRGTLASAAGAALLRAQGSAPRADVDNAVQAALVELLRDGNAALRAWQGRASLAGYLRVIASRVALNQVRGELRKGFLRFRPLDGAPEPAAPEAGDAADVEALRAAMERLPAREKLILSLFHFDGATYAQIARVMGIPAGSVAPTLMRAREKLRGLIGGST
ncbi:MAG: sigma-70 family RNA polymerase sigma factor [Planctomycetes bacterium]|nr:sigma-70 family RNA polymerase sigma factor [Planctomycetota bacterium]